ncbi:MAG: hypothetical protein AYL33_001260 [Candidatus Bathyarchaeota archaeon B63]|nr:MAG: hypothetical protein AYL33_001260 [Candidatus Bathyarchaeota archaeon B63]
MGRYIVFACPRCGVPRYAAEGQKTARCFYCGVLIRLDPAETRILLRAENARAAREAVEEYKMRRRIRGKTRSERPL